MRQEIGSPPDAMVAEVASRQDGAIATWQLRAAGLDGPAVLRRVRRGHLHPMLRGVYAVGHRAATRRTWWQAALLAAGPAGALSHLSAAQAWGIVPSSKIVPVHVTVEGAGGRARRDRLITHAGQLQRTDWVVRDGLRVTTVPRTLLDLAESTTTEELVEVLDRAEAQRLHHPRAVNATLAAARGRRGAKRLKAALLITRPQDVLTRSQLERRALRLIAAHGLPRPDVDLWIGRHEVDLHWPAHHLAVELDGRTFHGTAVDLDRDHRRDADLRAHGLTVARYTWRQVTGDPEWVAHHLKAELRRTAPSRSHPRR